MTWILTNSGVEFDLQSPTPEMINLHDAHEAYLGDITSPLKDLLGPQLGELERSIDAVISKRLKVGLISNSIISLFDLRHLKYEKEQFLEKFGKHWPCLSSIHTLTVPKVLAAFYEESDCLMHERLFLTRCEELGVCDA